MVSFYHYLILDIFYVMCASIIHARSFDEHEKLPQNFTQQCEKVNGVQVFSESRKIMLNLKSMKKLYIVQPEAQKTVEFMIHQI